MAQDCNTVTPETDKNIPAPFPQFFLTIPCEPKSKPDTYEPNYRVKLNEFGGVECGTWQCRECGRIYHTRRKWATHKGMKSNIMGDCTGEIRKTLGVK